MQFYKAPDHVPLAFSLAVWQVLHNQADRLSWEVLQAAGKSAYQWLQEIYDCNGFQYTTQERQWWRVQLSQAVKELN